MDGFDHTVASRDADKTGEPQQSAELTALWLALDADHRARDERTARLRAMRLICGEDDAS